MSGERTPRSCSQADIARALGVSVTTVSLALRGSPKLPRATVERVRAEAERLGYVPSPAIGRLMALLRQGRRGRHEGNMVGLYHPPFHSLYISHLLAAVRGRATELGYSFEVEAIALTERCRRKQERAWQARGVGGLLLLPSEYPVDLASAFDWRAHAVVTAAHNPVAPDFDRVTSHWFHAIRLCVAQCVSRGYRRLGFVLGAHYELLSRYMTTAAMELELKCQGVPWLPPLYFLCEAKPAASPLLTREFQEIHRQGAAHRFTQRRFLTLARGLLPWLDEAAPYVLVVDKEETAAEVISLMAPIRGRRVPCVVISRSPECAFAGVCLPAHRVGVAAVDLLDEKIRRGAHGLPSSPKCVLYSGVWMEGPSLPASAVATAE